MPYDELLSRRVRQPDRVIRYGPHPEQVADLLGGGERGVVILVHGGFWRAEYDRLHVRPMADALAADGYTVCSLEYRRIGHEGGGYPGTFDDVTTAVATVLAEVPAAGPVVLVGHSAGGHLALWHGCSGGRISGVVALAALSDVGRTLADGLGGGAGSALVGGRAELLRHVDTMRLPWRDEGGPVLVHGVKDRVVPVEMSRRYAARNPSARLVELPDVGHFKLIDPLSRAWPAVRAAIGEHDTSPERVRP